MAGLCLLQMPQELSASSLILQMIQRLEFESLELSHCQALVEVKELVDMPFPYLLRYSLDCMYHRYMNVSLTVLSSLIGR